MLLGALLPAPLTTWLAAPCASLSSAQKSRAEPPSGASAASSQPQEEGWGCWGAGIVLTDRRCNLTPRVTGWGFWSSGSVIISPHSAGLFPPMLRFYKNAKLTGFICFLICLVKSYGGWEGILTGSTSLSRSPFLTVRLLMLELKPVSAPRIAIYISTQPVHWHEKVRVLRRFHPLWAGCGFSRVATPHFPGMRARQNSSPGASLPRLFYKVDPLSAAYHSWNVENLGESDAVDPSGTCFKFLYILIVWSLRKGAVFWVVSVML